MSTKTLGLGRNSILWEPFRLRGAMFGVYADLVFLVLFIHALLPKSVKTLGLGRNSIHWEPLRYYVEVGESKITHKWGEYKGGQKKIGVTMGETTLTT